jgi:hypothetical protein
MTCHCILIENLCSVKEGNEAEREEEEGMAKERKNRRTVN